jgi:hypothetical protein
MNYQSSSSESSHPLKVCDSRASDHGTKKGLYVSFFFYTLSSREIMVQKESANGTK